MSVSNLGCLWQAPACIQGRVNSHIPQDVLHHECLHFSVWDHDIATSDDPLGNADVLVPSSADGNLKP